VERGERGGERGEKEDEWIMGLVRFAGMEGPNTSKKDRNVINIAYFAQPLKESLNLAKNTSEQEQRLTSSFDSPHSFSASGFSFFFFLTKRGTKTPSIISDVDHHSRPCRLWRSEKG
jgi:hypothetical protein